MRRLILILAAGILAAPGCGSHHKQVVRPDPAEIDRAANDPKPEPRRINNGESEAVKNWSTGGP